MRNKVSIFYDTEREAIFIGTVRDAFPPRTLEAQMSGDTITISVAYSSVAIFSDTYTNILGRAANNQSIEFATANECLAYLLSEFAKRRRVNCECTQDEPSAHWILNHCLGFRPNVTVVDTAGTQILGAIRWPDTNTVEIDFEGTPVAGVAYLS